MSSILATVVEIDWVRSVKVASWSCTVRIAVPELSISVSQKMIVEIRNTYSTRVIGGVEVERIRRFTKTVQIWCIGESRPHAQVLRLKDE